MITPKTPKKKLLNEEQLNANIDKLAAMLQAENPLVIREWRQDAIRLVTKKGK